jgi:hypothetical protein
MGLVAALLDELLCQHIAGREENLRHLISGRFSQVSCSAPFRNMLVFRGTGPLSQPGWDKEGTIARDASNRVGEVHTAVVILCVNSGAVLSFAWYLSVQSAPSLLAV